MRRFRLAPMSPLVLGLTVALWLLPVGLVLGALAGRPVLLGPAALLVVLYAVVWAGARPTRFEAAPGALTIVFPVWTRRIMDLASVVTLTSDEFRRRFGWALRIGVGGLWGGFGWLWTSRGGLVEFYVSRTHGFVLLERSRGRPLLVTPDDAAGLVAATSLARIPRGT